MDFSSDGAVQADIPIDGSVAPTKGLFASLEGSDAFIVSISGIDTSKVSCQAFSDAEGRISLGEPFSNIETATFSISDVLVGAFSCKVI